MQRNYESHYVELVGVVLPACVDFWLILPAVICRDVRLSSGHTRIICSVQLLHLGIRQSRTLHFSLILPAVVCPDVRLSIVRPSSGHTRINALLRHHQPTHFSLSHSPSARRSRDVSACAPATVHSHRRFASEIRRNLYSIVRKER